MERMTAFLIYLCLNQVSCAVTPVFVKKGDDVLLNVTETDVPEKFTLLTWKFSTDDVLVSFVSGPHPKIEDEYAGRVEPDVNKFSVKLKNLQKSDSGVYAARLTGSREKIVAEYNVTVQDPVSPVRLTVVHNSSDFCNITVTCSTDDSHISSTFICDTTTCYQEGGNRSEITKAGASFQVYLSNKSITCKHSNQVSRAETETRILDRCSQPGLEVRNNNIYIGIVVVVVVVFAGLFYLKKRRKCNIKVTENTEYSSHQCETIQTNGESSAHDEPGPSPTTTYSTVGFHTRMDFTETKGNNQPEPVYAQCEPFQTNDESSAHDEPGPSSSTTYSMVGFHLDGLYRD
ncbi:uncharacterized protein LOC121644292 [Melanotaenia boesemani]|uniref:uncharacterized protein LOC121644292 n=1 Tax=Melanotaenia boesemani TaxID=1250792 RepID=UPI001C0516DF|nr:uncharacterized protein LOC121644292 [Melanotaenia boesemani]